MHTLRLQLTSARISVLAKRELSSLDHSDEQDLRLGELEAARRITGKKVFSLKQVHGTDAVQVEDKSQQTGIYFAEADAVFTSRKDVALMVRTADCLPLFFEGRGEETWVGVIHAGWRGLAAGIIQSTLSRVIELGKIATLKIAPGPCISGKNYEVGLEVAERFRVKESKGAKFHVDLIENAKEQWNFPGVQIELLEDFRGCTVDNYDLYYSHRKGDMGRNLNLIHIED